MGKVDAVTRGGGAIGRGGAAALVLLAAAALLPAAAMNDAGRLPIGPPEQALAALDAPCGDQPLPSPDRVVTGSFTAVEEGAYVMLPFDVPAGTDAIRLKYCHDQPLLAMVPGTDTLNKHTLDMGVYGPRSGPGELWGEDEFRGWGGSSRKDVTISPEATIDPDPAPVASEETTVGYRPGPIAPGEWAVELGVAAIGTELPVEDDAVQWRVEIDVIDDPAFTDEPYEPVAYDETPASSGPGWYAGDFHVHARNSAPGDATMRESFDYAFAPLGEGAGLDFITLSDYVTDRSWGEIGAFQDDYPGKLIVRSSEVITYRGHLNNHASGEFVDYRTGRVLEGSLSAPSGGVQQLTGLTQVRATRPASEILGRIRDAGGWTQLNHVRIFPSAIPGFGNFCRGCSWDYSDAETDYSLVDAIEVATGPAGLQLPTNPGPSPFTALGVQFYEDAIDAEGRNSNHIAAVGSSDSHNAGTPDDPLLQSPIGQATTVVHAEELSEQGIGDGVRAGHTYVKIWGNDGPDLRLEAADEGSLDPPAIIGDTLEADAASFTAQVLNLDRARAARPGVYTLSVVRNGLPYAVVPIPATGDEFTYEFEGAGPARYRLQVDRLLVGLASIEAVSSPIYLEAPGGGGGGGGGGDGGDDDAARGACSIRIVGTGGRDRLIGAGTGERIRGRGGKDVLKGRGGNDCLSGGPGRDRLRCGPGARDVARVGRRDRVRGCETVRRRARN